MLNEWKEFQDYTGTVNYTARNKQDTTYLGRFTFDTILDFEGLNRVLAILARGFLFHNEDGGLVKAPRERIDYAKRGLCAWCSVPDSKKATPREAWQFGSDFGELHVDFPGLVEENGNGWFHRHVHRVEAFVRENPERVSSSAQKKCSAIEKGFDQAWRDKVIQMQIPLFAPTTKGQWGLRFDSCLAQALELGPLRNEGPELSPALVEQLRTLAPKGVSLDMVKTLVSYYLANKPEDSDWVVLPVANFDAYFGTTSFGRKYLKQIPETIMERSETGFGLCRYRLGEGIVIES
ncbi:hypothetical protein [Anaerotruncus colihominis]|uniref:Uncharacterized protein n=1 Tax=Anaerotruncus colihominis TaxID=169435 RepID=A0A174NQX7_9FIRM|nr:hypothetical protein [Anaerotruncus colihominis]MBS4987671.1 hypothetical protein [Anaerotruncus colihominis]MCQ4733283.1 hypothetical protein [Anaerotruncus colihominis]CUP49651.1 Uncharacterised protein [Anaerotruncus colihominis]